MRLVPAHPARTSTSGPNPGARDPAERRDAPLVTDLSLEDLERDARHVIGEMAYAYYSGGADDERLLEGNVAAWGHWQLHPHVLAGIDEVSPATTLLGTPVRVAGGGGAHGDPGAGPCRGRGGERPGRRRGGRPARSSPRLPPARSRTWPPRHPTPRAGCRSTSCASAPARPSWCSEPPPTATRRWCSPSTRRYPGCACANGATGVHLPDDLALPNLAGDSTGSAREGGFMAVVTYEFEPALTPDDIGWLAGLSALPVVVKGVQRADDAVRCVEAGAAAVVVSNHGARQLADAPPTADILPEIVDAVAGRGRGLRRRRRAPRPRRGQGAGARRPGRPGRAALAVGAGHRRGRRRGRAAALVRDRAPPDHGAVSAPPPSARSTAAWCGARPAGPWKGRCRDHRRRDAGRARRRRPHRGHGRHRPVDLARGRAAGGRPGRAGPVALRRRPAPHRRAPAQRPRVPVLAQRRGAGRRGRRRDQPDPTRRGPGGGRAGHRLHRDRDRQRGRRTPGGTGPRRRRREDPRHRFGALRGTPRRVRGRRGGPGARRRGRRPYPRTPSSC